MPTYLRPNHSNRVPRHHVCVDTETNPEPIPGHPTACHHRLMMGCALAFRADPKGPTCRDSLSFSDRRTFWEWLYARAQKNTQTWIWAHNAAFDFTTLGLWDEIDLGRLVIKGSDRDRHQGDEKQKKKRDDPVSLVSGAPPFLVDCHGPDGKSYRFVDSLNWAFLSLEKIGAMIDLPKLPMPGEQGTDDDWREYCARDVSILGSLVTRICDMVRTYDMGNMSWTLSGQSAAHYRHRHMRADILTGPDPDHRPLERDSYYAARQHVLFRGKAIEGGTEVFHRNQIGVNGPTPLVSGPIHRIDCNSCYPYVMSCNHFPTRPFRTISNPTVRQLADYLTHFVGIAAVRLETPDEPYPARVRKVTQWRTHDVSTVLAGAELVRAVRSGHVVGCDRAQFYVSEPIFRSWFDETQTWREQAEREGDKLKLTLLKRMRNSLHGKFGQTGRVWESVPGKVPVERWGEYDHLDTETNTHQRRRGVGGLLQILRTDPDAPGSCPAIAACVTAAAREHIRSAWNIAGARHVFYVDADSLHVDDQGLAELGRAGWIHPSLPGKFKVEASADMAEYRGVKNYTFGDTVVMAGHADKGSYDAKGIWHQTEWVSLDSLIARGMPTAPITIDRTVADAESKPDCLYGADGWIIYRSGIS